MPFAEQYIIMYTRGALYLQRVITQGVILFIFSRISAPRPPHASPRLPWMSSARRNPLPPAVRLRSEGAGRGTEGVWTSHARAEQAESGDE